MFSPATSLFDQLLRAFEHADGPTLPSPWAPEVQVDREQAVLRFDLPGVSAEDVQIEWSDGVLSLRASRSRELPEGARVLRQERQRHPFAQDIRLPWEADADSIQASLAHGVLEVRISRAQADRPRRIAVQAAKHISHAS